MYLIVNYGRNCFHLILSRYLIMFDVEIASGLLLLPKQVSTEMDMRSGAWNGKSFYWTHSLKSVPK
jgi:hypothetical protein